MTLHCWSLLQPFFCSPQSFTFPPRVDSKKILVLALLANARWIPLRVISPQVHPWLLRFPPLYQEGSSLMKEMMGRSACLWSGRLHNWHASLCLCHNFRMNVAVVAGTSHSHMPMDIQYNSIPLQHQQLESHLYPQQPSQWASRACTLCLASSCCSGRIYQRRMTLRAVPRIIGGCGRSVWTVSRCCR